MSRFGLMLACSLTATAAAAQTDTTLLTVSAVAQTPVLAMTQAETIDPMTAGKFYTLPTNCRSLCIAPTLAADGVATVDETDVIAFLADTVADGHGLLVDARMPVDRALGYIDASVNVPVALMLPDNPYGPKILSALGVRQFDGARNFSDALPLVVFDAGPTTTDAPQLITELLKVGYPSEKIRYYRGGMQFWSAVGLQIKED